MLEGLTISNGLDWSLDDRTMYFIDSGAGGVDAFAYDPGSGSIENRRRLIDISIEAGLPDGMTVDEEGFLWSRSGEARAFAATPPTARSTRASTCWPRV